MPGQGSQTPGFLEPWLELPGISETLNQWSDGVDLATHGTTSDEETIKDTAVAQPLIVAADSWQLSPRSRETRHNFLDDCRALGRRNHRSRTGWSASIEALEFVRVRAQGMAAAAAIEPTGMAAVLGGDQDEVISYLEEHGITPANVNGGSQVVAAGSKSSSSACRKPGWKRPA